MLIGKRISGRYKILDMVGGGGMANVYLAQDMILEREVALKILRMDFSNDEEFIKRFNREAQSATSLAHPNIVSIYDVGEEKDIYYIVMEYVKGLTLKQYIQKYYPIPIEKAVDIMKQITAAIAHAHHNGIIHRDIKPQNILIDDHGNVKITDFGIAMALSATSITQTNAVLGSVHYLSPEQARGGMANKKSDIYSLGIVMFEIVTGRLPFSGESAVSIALKHLQSETPSPRRWNPEIPQSVENIILKATAKDSYYRYSSVDEMEDDIRTALQPERINETPFTIPEDEEATKAIPIITNDNVPPREETLIRDPDRSTIVNAEQSQPKEKKKNTAPKDKKKGKKVMITLLIIFTLLLTLGILTVTVFPQLLGPEEVKVPDVRGEDLDDALTSLMGAGFEIGETHKLEDEEIPDGAVIKTDPEAGKLVKEGQEIDIYRSTGKGKVELSDYRERLYETIQPNLKEIGFKEIDIQEEFNEESEPGTILEQSPSPGTEVVPSETVLELVVSKGADKITLKDLKEYTKKSLDDYEDEAGIIIEVDKEEYHDTIPVGQVISQSPAAYTKINKGSTVKVVLSKGKEELPPKQVTRDITIEYAPVTPGEPQEVQIFIQDMTRDISVLDNSFFITETAKETLTFTIAPGTTAIYKVIRDNTTIFEEYVPYPDEE
ncbi:Stk1 family PASTA domain-containing Ser/Thr kinase [Peribacillus saganii]|uniref:Serine/threonine-protein kinase PrkC n=1 Tax=Peribacillus saganii TaxID=2303992 RepID=A0A372LBN6_9BACI|nr:Stk1 family PASTA domain-containing Ser/Thr kinase [Peribacillus saganii]RFU63224.1 Stk1 family PASTA domain-containing Ser/Thr kinase [Peribacillus saganii]